MPYTKVVDDVYEKLLTWSISKGVRPSTVLTYLLEEHAYVLDPSGVHVAFQWESVSDNRLIRVAISRMAFYVLKDLTNACAGLPGHAIATLLLDEHMDSLIHSPEAYPGLGALASKSFKGRVYRPTVGIYRPIYVLARAQAGKQGSAIRSYCLRILGAYDETTYLEAGNTTDFMAFRNHYSGHGFVPIPVPVDISRTLTMLKEVYQIPKGPLVSYMLWREVESRALLERQGVKLQTGRAMSSLWGTGVNHAVTMHESTLSALEGEEE